MTVPPPPGELGDDGPDDLALDQALDQLTRWVAEAQVDEAVVERRRTGWRRRRDDEEVTVAGLLTDLAERGAPVVVTAETGRRHQGVITSVGPDVVGLRTDGTGPVLMALASISSFRGPADAGRGRSDAAPGAGTIPGLSLRGALARWAGDRLPVVVVTQSGEIVRGELAAVGPDVVSLALDGGGAAYVPLASVSEVGAPESG